MTRIGVPARCRNRADLSPAIRLLVLWFMHVGSLESGLSSFTILILVSLWKFGVGVLTECTLDVLAVPPDDTHRIERVRIWDNTETGKPSVRGLEANEPSVSRRQSD